MAHDHANCKDLCCRSGFVSQFERKPDDRIRLLKECEKQLQLLNVWRDVAVDFDRSVTKHRRMCSWFTVIHVTFTIAYFWFMRDSWSAAMAQLSWTVWLIVLCYLCMTLAVLHSMYRTWVVWRIPLRLPVIEERVQQIIRQVHDIQSIQQMIQQVNDKLQDEDESSNH